MNQNGEVMSDKQRAKITFSKYDGDDYITVDNHKEATGVTLWRNDESEKSWKNLSKTVKEKFTDFHPYQEDKDRLLMLRNREIDARSYLEKIESGVVDSDDTPF